MRIRPRYRWWVRTAAAAREAARGVAFLDSRVPCEVTGLLLLEGDRCNILEAYLIAVDEDKLHFGEGLRSTAERGLLQEACADDDLRACISRCLHGVEAVIIGRLIAVCGLIVLVGLAVVGSVLLDAFPRTLVEGLVLQRPDVGNKRILRSCRVFSYR